MRRPRMSLGSWIFASVLTAVLIPTGAWAATSTSSPVHLTNSTGATNVGVTSQGQLLTAPVSPINLIHIVGTGSTDAGTCSVVYTPPAGKALVVTSVTYYLEAGSSGFQQVDLFDCKSGNDLDAVVSLQSTETVYRTYPTGLPAANLGIATSGGQTAPAVVVNGYLIPAAQLPKAAGNLHVNGTLGH